MELTLTVVEEGSGREEERTVEVAAGRTVREVLDAADISPETVLVEHDGEIVTQQDEVGEDMDGLRVLDVIAGG